MHCVGDTNRIIVHSVELRHQHGPRVRAEVRLGAARGADAPGGHLGHHGEAGAEAGLAGARAAVRVAVLPLAVAGAGPRRGQLPVRGLQHAAVL